METDKLFLTVSVLICLCHGLDIHLPDSVTAVKGSCVVVPCWTSLRDSVIWYKYQSSGYPPVYSSDTAAIIEQFRERTSLPRRSTSDCSLRINNIRQEDHRIQVYPYIKSSSDSYKYILITVVDPEIYISVERTQTTGKPFTATCTVRHSCSLSPPPIEWMGLSYTSNNVDTTETTGGLWTSVARAQFIVNHLDNLKTIMCRSQFSHTTIQSSTVSLSVSYAPTNVNITGADRSVVEGRTVSLTCTSNSNPQPTGYEWHVTQKNSASKYSGRKLSLTVQRDTSIYCTASNSVGQGQSTPVLLNVQFGPTILENSTCSGSSEGIWCVCQAEAEPKPTIIWTVDGRNAVPPHFNTTETEYVGRIAVSELMGPLASNVACMVSNALGSDSHQMSIQQPLSEGNSTLIIAAAVAGSCMLLGIAVMAICLKIRRQHPADSTIRSPTESSSKSNPYKTSNLSLNDNTYENHAAGEDIYANTMDIPQTSKVNDDIYENL